MDFEMGIDLGRDALITSMRIALPVLGTGIVVGLLISLLQTLTQIQDQTLNLIPKIIAMVAATVFFLPWIAASLIEFSQLMFGDP